MFRHILCWNLSGLWELKATFYTYGLEIHHNLWSYTSVSLILLNLCGEHDDGITLDFMNNNVET